MLFQSPKAVVIDEPAGPSQSKVSIDTAGTSKASKPKKARKEPTDPVNLGKLLLYLL